MKITTRIKQFFCNHKKSIMVDKAKDSLLAINRCESCNHISLGLTPGFVTRTALGMLFEKIGPMEPSDTIKIGVPPRFK